MSSYSIERSETGADGKAGGQAYWLQSGWYRLQLSDKSEYIPVP